MSRGVIRCTVVAACLCALIVLRAAGQHQSHESFPESFPFPLPARTGPLAKALSLMRDGKTAEAREELQEQLKARPNDADVLFQIARSHLLDFYRLTDPEQRRLALALAMESLNTTLKRDPNHVPALRAKAVIHARAELLYYDPNLSYELASRAAKLEPHANAYLLNLSEWMNGEVRFTKESGHRVPHDPLIGLDRSMDLLEQVIDTTMPYSNEEMAALYLMANTMSRRGNFPEAIRYYEEELKRPVNMDQRQEAMREIGACYYRMGNYIEAAKKFYEAMQWRMNSVDQWMYHVAVEQVEGPKPRIPSMYVFPRREATVDAMNPPLLAFEDIAPKLGIHHKNGNGTIGWGDIDGDGDLDLIVAGSGVFLRAYRNDGDKFTDVTEQIGLARLPSGYSVNLVDYDNDGWLDLYLSLNGWSGPQPNILLHNEHDKFVNVSKASGLDDPGSGFVSLWGDLDNDGWLDVVICNGVLKDGSVPQIYRNNKNGTFTNVTKEAGLNETGQYGGIGIALGDYDKDGRLDLFINGMDPAPNRLYHNDGNWHFTDVAKKAGVLQAKHNAFVAFIEDYNNDGWPDILTTALASWDVAVEALKKGYKPPRGIAHEDSTHLFRNNGDGTFTDVTMQSGLFYPMGTMGAGMADVDNDGFLDLYIGTGDPQMSRLEPNHLFHNNGNGTFLDVTDYVGFARPGNKGHGVAFVDIDNDGDLDIFAQLGGHYPGDHAYNAFYRNLKANQNSWLELELHGVKSNRFAVGAQITVRAGDFLVYREVKGSEGFGATNPYRQHFGLGKVEKLDSVEVRWPSGLVQTFQDVDARHILSLDEGAAALKRLQ